MSYDPLFDKLGTGILDPRTGKMMDAIGVLSQFENTCACQRTEVIHRKDMHIVLIDLILSINLKTTGNHDVCNGYRMLLAHTGTYRDRTSPRSIAAIHTQEDTFSNSRCISVLTREVPSLQT